MVDKSEAAVGTGGWLSPAVTARKTPAEAGRRTVDIAGCVSTQAAAARSKTVRSTDVLLRHGVPLRAAAMSMLRA
jgi:hypothetical protein